LPEIFLRLKKLKKEGREIMHFFLDTANLEEIKEAVSLGVIEGVTTNPSLVSKEELSFNELIYTIAELVKGPVSAEAVSLKSEEMIDEARTLAKIHPQVVVKIPMTAEGLKAVSVLSQEGIKVNMTLIFSANQGLLAARAGAAYVSPFIGRLDDVGQEGMQVVEDLAKIFNSYQLQTKIIAASIRHPLHVTEAALKGADIATIPFKVLMQMIRHPLTDIGIERFLKDWEKFKAKEVSLK